MRRYFRKEDVIKYIKESQWLWVSENELFLTEDKDVILVETVIGKARVMTIKEYDGLE